MRIFDSKLNGPVVELFVAARALLILPGPNNRGAQLEREGN